MSAISQNAAEIAALRNEVARLTEANAALMQALRDAVAALRSSAGPEERMNAVRDGRAALEATGGLAALSAAKGQGG